MPCECDSLKSVELLHHRVKIMDMIWALHSGNKSRSTSAVVVKFPAPQKNTLLRNSPPFKDDQKKRELCGGPGSTSNIKKTKWWKVVAGSVAKTARVIICDMLLLWLSEVLWL